MYQPAPGNAYSDTSIYAYDQELQVEDRFVYFRLYCRYDKYS